jgi:DNA-directed RNA polymerase specialized sigma24 family protein
VTFLREAVAALPEQERLSLQAFYLQGLDAEQARTVLGMSQPTFYRVLASARQQLRQALSRQEVLP